MLALEDLKDYDETKVLEHLANSYSGKESGFSYGEINEADATEAKEKLKNMEVLVAYESVGSWGCDSSSFFLLRDKITNKLYVADTCGWRYFGRRERICYCTNIPCLCHVANMDLGWRRLWQLTYQVYEQKKRLHGLNYETQ